MYECVRRKNVEIFGNQKKDEMDGTSVSIAKRCARTCVVEQGWEISILSQLKTELM